MLTAGCQSAHMPVPKELEAERLSVRGRQGSRINQSVSFGGFQVSSIDRSWVRGPDWVLMETLESNRRRQQFNFSITEDGSTVWESFCEATLRKKSVRTDIVDIEFEDKSELSCSLKNVESLSSRWTLELKSTDERPISGTLSSPTTSWVVSGTNKLERGLPLDEATGYEISGHGNQSVFVEVIGNGVVWMPALEGDMRMAAGATAAALLLFEDLRAHLPVAS